MERVYQTVKKISETLNTFFSFFDISDSLLKAIAKYKNHPCVRRVKNNYKNLTTFSFQYVEESNIEKKPYS